MKYNLTVEDKEKTRRFARRYPFWIRQVTLYQHSMKSQKMTDTIIKTNNISKPTENLALKNEKSLKYIDLVESTAFETDPFLWRFVLRSVTEKPKFVTYEKLVSAGLPCSRNTFYQRKKRFYWLLNEKLKKIETENGKDDEILSKIDKQTVQS